MTNPYKRLKLFLHSTFNNDTFSQDPEPEENMYTFQPLKMCLEYKSDVKKALKTPNEFPMPRSGHRIVCNSQYVISYGGYNPRSVGFTPRNQVDELYKEIWKFDMVHKTWRLLDVANTPPYAASNCCTLIGSNILTIFGGTSFPFGLQSGNDLYVLDLLNETEFNIVTGGEGTDEEALEGEHKPPGRYGQAVIIHDNILYTIGGTTGYVYSMDVHSLNFKSNEWSCLYNADLFGPGDPEPRYRHEIALYRGHIYLLGGGTEQRVFSLEDIHSFDLASNSWHLHHTRPDPTHCYPPPRKCHALAQGRSNPAHLVIFGGIGAGSEPVLSDVWRLDLESLTWAKLELNLPAPLYFHALASSPKDKIYIFGGITSRRSSPCTVDCRGSCVACNSRNNSSSSSDAGTSERTADLYSVYVNIPSLQEMSSEAVKHYYWKRIYDEQALKSYGIQFE